MDDLFLHPLWSDLGGWSAGVMNGPFLVQSATLEGESEYMCSTKSTL